MTDPDDGDMSLIGHLSELRQRLIVSIAAVLCCTVLSFVLARPVLTFLTAPISAIKIDPSRPAEMHFTIAPDGTMRVDNLDELTKTGEISLQRATVVLKADPAHGRPADALLEIGHKEVLRYPSPIDPFMMQFKVSLIMGLFLALPILLYQIWKFVQPGLTGSEERVVKPLLAGAVIMFPIGAGFAYLVLRILLRSMQIYQIDNISPQYDATKYLSLMTTLMLLFGLIFEMPLAMAIAANIGLIHPRTLIEYRKHAYVGLTLVAAALTPPDLFSMIAGLVPMILLYEASILLCKPIAALREREQMAKHGGEPPEPAAAE